VKKKILIVASDYYKDITNSLVKDAKKSLNAYKHKVSIITVPGTFEIPFALIKNIKKYDGFLALGCVIKGETPHFDFICKSTFDAIISISISYKKPITNALITCLTMEQAEQRSIKKGKEAAEALIKILKI
tara:strand:+ start:291 stop:683 length:393 start_codon:yes stop_codon:yes gene_type:complete